jgi:branched-chain amino acid transport system permease protein
MNERYIVERVTPVARVAFAFSSMLVILLASMPWWADAGISSTIVEFFYYLAIAQMWNLLAGYGGLVSIGQQAYIGIGGYVLAAVALKTPINPLFAIPLAGLVAGLVAFPVSKVLFRLNGAYFAVGTWVIAEVFRLLLANYTPLGGGTGTSITASLAAMDPWWREALIFWAALVLAVASVLGVYLFLRSRNGLALTAIRDSEIASESLGVRVPRIKLAVYVVSALGCGMIGALIYLVKLRISPDAAFTVEWSALAFLMVIIGGFGTIEGPIIGALVYFALRGLLAEYGTVYLIALGVVAIGVMLVERKGIWGAVQKRLHVELFPVQRRLESVAKSDDQP